MANPPGEHWSSRTGFILSTIGFSVGLGNIWRFPYVTGENGGGAFLLVYILCVLGFGLPLLIGELTIGRRGRASPTGSIQALARESGSSPRWGAIGTLAVLTVFLIFSYYTVIAGWTLDYLLRALLNAFAGIDGGTAGDMFDGLTANPYRLLFWHTLVIILAVVVVRRGLQQGLETAARILMPCLFVSLLLMVVYALGTGDVAGAMAFIFEPDFSKINFSTVMVAVGQAFFSIGIGMAALITFGSYMNKDTSIPRSAFVIVSADTLVALLAGLAIFPLVFAYGLPPGSGYGLIFKTLPVAFGQMPMGHLFGAVFFFLLVSAAMTSVFANVEAIINWTDEHWQIDRHKGALYTGAAAWLTGILTVLSFNVLLDFHPLPFIPLLAESTLYGVIDFVSANIMLLLGAMLTAIFLGWVVPKRIKLEEIGVAEGPFFSFWRWSLRIAAPPLLFLVLILGLQE